MAVATSTALIIAGGIAAGSSVAGAKIASKSNKEAAESQSAAATKAAEIEAAANKESLDWAKDIYKTERDDSAESRALGQSSARTLGSLMGFPGAQPAASAAQPNALPMDPTHIPPSQNFPSSWVPGSPFATGGSQMVRMIYPKTGEEQDVPRSQVDHWTKLGAEVKPSAAPTTMTSMKAPSIADLMARRSA